MRASEILINQLKVFEGCKLKAYRDTNKIPTIGIGHTRGVKMGQVITMSQAESLCRTDIQEMEHYVNVLGLHFTQGQYDALVDFVYNCGIGTLRKSKLLADIRSKADKASIENDFLQFVKSGGKVTPGLVTRRKWEIKRYFE
jgi:lysozyme